jgi:hypothetical protein
MTVVLAQAANAFACRSSTRRPGELGWTTNRLLIPAVAAALLISVAMLVVAPLAHLLDQAPPPAAGWAVAVAAVPLLLAVDALDKRLRRRPHPDGDHRPFAGTARKGMLGPWKLRGRDR